MIGPLMKVSGLFTLRNGMENVSCKVKTPKGSAFEGKPYFTKTKNRRKNEWRNFYLLQNP